MLKKTKIPCRHPFKKRWVDVLTVTDFCRRGIPKIEQILDPAVLLNEEFFSGAMPSSERGIRIA